MAKDGELNVTEEPAFPRTTTWGLPEQDDDSDDGPQSRHGQTRHGVVTGAARISTPNPRADGSSDDTAGVSSSLAQLPLATEEQEAEAERLRRKLGDGSGAGR